jgi:hypothetical protein
LGDDRAWQVSSTRPGPLGGVAAAEQGTGCGRANQGGMRTMYLAYWLVIAGGLAASIVIGLTTQ